MKEQPAPTLQSLTPAAIVESVATVLAYAHIDPSSDREHIDRFHYHRQRVQSWITVSRNYAKRVAALESEYHRTLEKEAAIFAVFLRDALQENATTAHADPGDDPVPNHIPLER